jgi:phage-related protein
VHPAYIVVHEHWNPFNYEGFMTYTKKLYTNYQNTVNFPAVSNSGEKLARIVWEPGTHDALCNFPDKPRQTLGHYLYLVQKGETPPTSSPVPGVPNVFELREDDERTWYRVIHLKTLDDRIHVLHCFEKQSNQIEKRDIRTIRQRLGRLNEWLAEERRNAKREKQSHAARNDGERSR